MAIEDEGKRRVGGAFARVLTFHVEQDHMPSMIRALDASLASLRHNPGFKGLLCLEHDGLRNQVMIVTIWGGASLAATVQEAEDTRELIAAAAHTGVASSTYEVLGLIPSAAGIPDVALAR